MTETRFPATTRIPTQTLTAVCVLLLCAIWLSPLLILALATGSLAGALSRHLLARIPHGTRAGPWQCEIPTALLWTLIAFLWQQGDVPTPWLAVLLPFTWVAVPLAVVDLRHHRLPRALTLPLVGATLPLLAIPALPTPPVLLHAVAGVRRAPRIARRRSARAAGVGGRRRGTTISRDLSRSCRQPRRTGERR